MVVVPPGSSDERQGQAAPGRPEPVADGSPSGIWFLAALAVVLIPFAIILIWVVLDAPKYLFSQ